MEYKEIGMPTYALSGKDYEREISLIMGKESLFGAIKHDGKVTAVLVNDIPGFAVDGKVVVLRDTSWNTLQAMARIHPDTYEHLEDEKFPACDHTIKVGLFHEVYKRGYVVFPLEEMRDFKNRAVVIRK